MIVKGVEEDGPPSVNRASPRVAPAVVALASLLIAGCVAGPNYVKPAAPTVADYTAQPLTTTASADGVAGGQAQRFAKGADISGDWWTLFHSQPLDALIDEAMA